MMTAPIKHPLNRRTEKMNKVLSSIIDNKKVLILGFGREGKSTLREIMALGGFSSVTISDKNAVSDIGYDNVETITGEEYLDCLDDFDVVFKSPGVVLPKSIDTYKCHITGEMDVFLEAYGKQVIGITGTKGKSTTSSLIAHILRESGRKVLFAGNIGIPVFDIAREVEPDSIIVVEMSCHQLEFIRFSPHVAVLLNIYEDHLDHYITRARYAEAKKNIYRYQDSSDVLFISGETLPECEDIPGEITVVDKCMAPFEKLEETGSMLKGEHNVLNAAFAYKAVSYYGITSGEFMNAFPSFKGLPHRLEFIGNKDGIDFYDDSISTTVKSAISAIESIDNAGTILLGGMERNLEYEELIDYLKTCKLNRIIFMYDSGQRMYSMYKEATKSLENAPEAVYTENLEEAVKNAIAYAKEGSAVLLSPAAASYGYFKNFEERGAVYKSLIF